MRSDRVEHLGDSNSFDLFGLCGSLDEDLLMQVVVVIPNVLFCLSQ